MEGVDYTNLTSYIGHFSKISKLEGCNFFIYDFFVPKKAGAHLQYACNIYAKIQIDKSKTVGGVDYTNIFRCDGQTDGQE